MVVINKFIWKGKKCHYLWDKEEDLLYFDYEDVLNFINDEQIDSINEINNRKYVLFDSLFLSHNSELKMYFSYILKLFFKLGFVWNENVLLNDENNLIEVNRQLLILNEIYQLSCNLPQKG